MGVRARAPVTVAVPVAVPLAVTVAEVMLARPKVLPVTASVGEVRAVLADDHVHMVLLTDGDMLRGTVVRGDLPATAGPQEPALGCSRLAGRTVAPSADAEGARQQLVESGGRRLAVVDERGHLLGLLCLKRRRTGFCGDADVAARACGR